MNKEIQQAEQLLKSLNPGLESGHSQSRRNNKLQKVLVANRGEIAKRFFMTLKEEGIPSVAVATDPDRNQSWHEFADEVVFIGEGPNYTNIPIIVAAAKLSGANAVYPGYGFLSENYTFVETLLEHFSDISREMIFMGPPASIMRKVGHKLDARALARENGVPLFDGTPSLEGVEDATVAAAKIGYPVIVKLNAGGGGKGMIQVYKQEDLGEAIQTAQRIGRNSYEDDSFYLEKFITKPVHIEVQIFNGTAIGIRKCAVQRRNQKVIEESGDVFLNNHMTLSLLSAAENMAAISGYMNGGGAGTVEFLYDADAKQFGFLEVNTRLQVEYPVTDLSLGIDLAKWQIVFFDGRYDEINYQQALKLRFVEKNHAIQCRIYAEDPDNDYAPSPGEILDLDLPTFNGIRCDFGFKKGEQILPDYDPMVGKLLAHGANREEALVRMERALSELYIKGITTNVDQLIRIIRNEEFRAGNYTNRLLDDFTELVSSEHMAKDPEFAAIAGALSEYSETLNRATAECFLSDDVENILTSSRLQNIPAEFSVDVYGEKFQIILIQLSLSEVYVNSNGRYIDKFKITSRLDEADDFRIVFQGGTTHLRVDRRPSFSSLRMRDERGKIVYYRVKVTPVGSSEKEDLPGMMRSPFQGSFVKFMETAPADGTTEAITLSKSNIVKKGDPIITISAMKMETTIRAPIDGTVDYLIEDGDLTRLIKDVTAAGQIIGRSIAEGEILAIVRDNTQSNEDDDEDSSASASAPADSDTILEHLQTDSDIKQIFLKRTEKNLPVLMKLLKASFLGVFQNTEMVSRLKILLGELGDDFWRYDNARHYEKELEHMVIVYTTMKQIFSTALSSNFSYFGELNQLVSHWEDESYRPPQFFQRTLNQLFRQYGISKWSAEKDNPERSRAFMFILRGYYVVQQNTDLIRAVLKITSSIDKLSESMINSLNKLIRLEQAERDDSIAILARRCIASYIVSDRRRRDEDTGLGLSKKHIDEYKKFIQDPFGSIPGVNGDIKARIEEAVNNPEKDLLPANLPEWVSKNLEERFAILKLRHSIERLHSPLDMVVPYRLNSLDGSERQSYLVFAYPEGSKLVLDRNENDDIIGVSNMETAAINAARIYATYEKTEKLNASRIELFMGNEPLELNLSGAAPQIMNTTGLINFSRSVSRFFMPLDLKNVILSILVKNQETEELDSKQYSVVHRKGRLSFDLLRKEDSGNFYWDGVERKAEQRLFSRDKWPAEYWAYECFNHGTMREILIDSIDKNTEGARDGGFRPVGAKLYRGDINKTSALFFMKDSRIAGGATGDLEGRKFVAAAYLAYQQDLPLYIWNDGAGANIKQGMVSLNRAGEGFMMNSLLAHNVDPATFGEYITNCQDPVIRDLFTELEALPNIEKVEGRRNSLFLVAVGVGSSTGLDVYGSSQACLQVIIDTNESYRVLTGSNVIRSVTGEDLTNYEIGGARVMGQWTGTVDIVASDKIQLITYIHRIQNLFSSESTKAGISKAGVIRSDDLTDSADVDDSQLTVLSEQLVRPNVDGNEFLPMKDMYHGSRSLIGGFAKLGGRRALIMGPRTHLGLRSFACATRARELLAIAEKTRSARILVFGERWHYSLESEDHLDIRSRTDFMQILHNSKAIRIHIVTHINGMKLVDINSSADAIIFVKPENASENELALARKTATFLVDELAQAFDLSHNIINLLSPLAKKKASPPEISDVVPDIPAETNQPFDMIEQVINPVLDKDTFLEFYGEMNDPAGGPSLVTGLGMLNGEPVGIIADQPKDGGAPDAPGTEKFRFFMQFLDHHKMPLVMLNNAPGFIPGTKQERLRIQQIGAESLDVNVLSTVPVVSVVLNQNYGGRQIHAFSKYLRPGIVYIALRRAVLAVMGAAAAFDLFKGKEYGEMLADGRTEEAEEFRNTYIKEFNDKSSADKDAANTGVVDWVVDEIKDLRENVIKAMTAAKGRAETAFNWKR